MNMHDSVASRDENGLHSDAMPVNRVLAGKMMVKQRTTRIVKTNRRKGAEFDKMATPPSLRVIAVSNYTGAVSPLLSRSGEEGSLTSLPRKLTNR